MSITNVNLDKQFGSGINWPRVDGIPLYVRTDNEEVLKGRAITPKWMEKSTRMYNSPTNIRRIMVSYGRVQTEFHTAYANGAKNNKRIATVELNSADKILSGALQIADTALGRPIIGDETIKLSGTGLKAINQNWVASNLEEIYFDWSVLTSPQFLQVEQFRNLLMASLNAMGKNVTQVKQLDHQVAFEILRRAINNQRLMTESEILEQFPRLHTVAFFSNLNAIPGNDWVIARPTEGNVEESFRGLLGNEKWKPVMQSIGGYTSIHRTNLYGKVIPKIVSRPGIYRFDAEYMEEYASKHERACLEKVKITKGNTDNFEKPESEQILDQLMAEKGYWDTFFIVVYSWGSSTKREIDAEIATFSPEGQKFYGEMLSHMFYTGLEVEGL